MNQFPNKLYFSVTFPGIPVSVIDAWRGLTCFLQLQGLLPKRFSVSQIAGHAEKYHTTKKLALAADEITQLITKRNLNGFWVNSGNFERCEYLDFSLLHAKNLGNQSTLTCYIGNKAKAPDDWKDFIEQLLESSPCIGAWQWKSYYQSWQTNSRQRDNSKTTFGPIPPGTKRWTEKSSDGYGPDTEYLDTSLNPGRNKELIPTIRFYPSAEMWLGPHFWQYAKCSKKEALAADFFIEKRDTPHYLYLKCWPEAFTRPDGEQGRMQQRLWKLFFHEDCEWPPGSGTICDEPMYGPPELMPGYKAGTDG